MSVKAASGKPYRQRIAWIFLTALCLSVLGCGGWYVRQGWQKTLNHALIAAIRNEDTLAAIALLEEGADANTIDTSETPEALKGFLNHLWNKVRGRPEAQYRDDSRCALLLPYWFACYPDRADMPVSPPKDNAVLVHALLEHGANPYARGRFGYTLLHYAAISNHCSTVEVLLDHHVNPNLTNPIGQTPLMLAQEDCARLLLAYGADVNARDFGGLTPLMYASSPTKVRLLLNHQAAVNAQDRDGQTALCHAVNAMDKDVDSRPVVRLLLEHGARVSVRDKEHKTALDYARNINFKEANISKQNKQNLIRLLKVALRKDRAQPAAKE